MTELRTEQHISERGEICPNCGAKDSIVYQKEGTQSTLSGHEVPAWRKQKPKCSRCGSSFSKGTYFKRMR